MREPRTDKRPEPTKEPNVPHYYFEKIMKNIKTIIASMLIVFCVIAVLCEPSEDAVELCKVLTFSAAGFLFGNIQSR